MTTTNASYPDLFVGIKFYGHNSSIFSVFPREQDCYGMQTERLTRFKHDSLFPLPVIRNMLHYKNIDPESVKTLFVGSSFICQGSEHHPVKLYELEQEWRRLLDAQYIKDYEQKQANCNAMPLSEIERFLLSNKHGKQIIEYQRNYFGETQNLNTIFHSYLAEIFPNAEIHITYHDHEYCHAISSYYTSPYEEAVLVTFDGWGDESIFSRVYLAKKGVIKEIGNSKSPIRLLRLSKHDPNITHECSIGGIYSYFTYLLGFRPESDEGKVEALAAYGNWDNIFYRELMSLVSVAESGGIEIDYHKTLDLLDFDRMSKRLSAHKREDLAAAVQKFTEDIILKYIQIFVDKTGVRKLCLSGGVFANVIVNLRIFKEISDEIFIVPAMADDGAAQGAAILELVQRGYSYNSLKWLKTEEMPYWGSSHTRLDIVKTLKQNMQTISFKDLHDNWPEIAAQLITEGKVGGLYHGRMEWGPRALGNRSIIADARNPMIQEILNRDIKNRPYFQPFCPSMLEEEMNRLFDKAYLNKHMTIAFDMKKEFWDQLPGAIHIDGTSRVQFVSSEDNEHYYRLIKHVKELTGFGVVINTSFNKHGRTIVESPEDALKDFLDSNMDFLVMEGFLVTKNQDRQSLFFGAANKEIHTSPIAFTAETAKIKAMQVCETFHPGRSDRKAIPIVAIIFSKNRAMQLECTIRSFFKYCRDSHLSQVKVLWTASGPTHEKQYELSAKEYPLIDFVKENDFKSDLIASISPCEYVLFLVDDNVFVSDFSVAEICMSIERNEDALGFSLRLGKNTTHCYMLKKKQELPGFKQSGDGILKYNWTKAEYDFGYPLEVSSSVFAVKDILPLLREREFRNPNTLEFVMDRNKTLFSNSKNNLLCFEQSVAFCNPVNMVQNMWANRAGSREEYSPEILSTMFGKGFRIDLDNFHHIVPGSCHQEIPLRFVNLRPLASIIILNYNGLKDIQLCLDSIEKNTLEEHEIIVVDNASTDGSLEYLRSRNDIILVQNPTNMGCPPARAQALELVRGKYIIFLDNDTIVTRSWLKRFIEHAQTDEKIGMIGPRSNYVSGPQLLTPVPYTDIEGLEQFAEQLTLQNKGMVSSTHRLVGFCMFIKRDVVNKIGNIDASFGKFGFEDDDYTWRANIAGFRTVIAHDIFIHHGGGPQGRGDKEYNRLLNDAWNVFKAKWEMDPDIEYGSLLDLTPILSRPFDLSRHYIELPNSYDVTKLAYLHDALSMSIPQPGEAARQKDVIAGLLSVLITESDSGSNLERCIESLCDSIDGPWELFVLIKEQSKKIINRIRKALPEYVTFFAIEAGKVNGFATRFNEALIKTAGEQILILADNTIVFKTTITRMLACLKKQTNCGIVVPVSNRAIGIQQIPNTHEIEYREFLEYTAQFCERNRDGWLETFEIDTLCVLIKGETVDKVGLFDENIAMPFFAVNDYRLRSLINGYTAAIALDSCVYTAAPRMDRKRSDRTFREKWDTYDPATDEGKRLSPWVAVRDARDHYGKDRLNESIEALMDGIKRAPHERSIYHCLADILMEEKLYQQAIDTIKSIPEGPGTTVRSLEILGHCSFFLDRYQEAGDYAAEISALPGGTAAGLYLTGLLSLKQNDRKGAEDCFRRAIKVDGNLAGPQVHLGVLIWQKGDHAAAFDLIEKGFLRSPETGDFAATYQSAVSSLKEFARAEQVVLEALQLHPGNRKLTFLHINILLESEKYPEAMVAIQKAIETFGIDDDMLAAALTVREKLGPVTIKEGNGKASTLSVCMIVKNEEEHIARCLASLVPVADEIIVVDTGSTDRTTDIARVFGAMTFDFAWTDDFSAARNFSLGQASGRWILVHDADEVLSPLDHIRLRKIINTGKSGSVAYQLTTRNYITEPATDGWTPNDGFYDEEEAGNGWFPSTKVRLFTNDRRVRFTNPVHEVLEPSIIAAGIEIRACDIPIHHYGKLPSDRNRVKSDVYYLLGKKKLEEMGNTPAALRELAVQAAEMGKYAEAIIHWQEFIKLVPASALPYFNMATIYMEMGQHEEALRSATKAREIDPDSKESALTCATASICNGNPEEAIAILEELLYRVPVYPPAEVCLAAAYCVAGKKETGVDFLKKLLKKGYNYYPALNGLSKKLISSRNSRLALRLLEPMHQILPSDGNTVALVDECMQSLRHMVAGNHSPRPASG